MQSQKLLDFIKEVADEGCHFNLKNGCYASYDYIAPCMACKAAKLLEVIEYDKSATTYGLLESGRKTTIVD